MDDNQLAPEQSVDVDQEIYNRNRKRFLKLVRMALGFLGIIVVIAGALFLIQSRRLEAEKQQLNSEYKEIQTKHQDLENPK